MNKKGFTLVEVIVSIVLVSVIMVSMLSSLVKLRDTYTVIHENSDVIVYTSSIARVINNDLMENNGIRYANCTTDGKSCELILGNDQKRKLEIIENEENLGESRDILHERTITTLRYTNSTGISGSALGSLIYIRSLTLDKYTNNKTGVITTEGYNFYDMNVPEPHTYYNETSTYVDTISTVNIRMWDGKSSESTKYDIALYSSGRYDESGLIGQTYKIALDTAGAQKSGTVEIDEVFGVAYFDSEKSHSSKNIVRTITIPSKTDTSGKPMAFLGYYYYKGENDTLGTQIIDSTGKIVASSRVFKNDITLPNSLEVLREEDKLKLERVVALWDDCTEGYKVENGKCTPETYTVTLNKNGGTGGSNSYRATYKSIVPSLTSTQLPTRVGYTFNGYYRDTIEYNDENGVGKVIYDLTSGTELLASWNKITYQVSYALNGGRDGSSAPTSITYDTDLQISNPTKTFTVNINTNSQNATLSSNSASSTQTFSGWTSNTNNGLGSNAKSGTSVNPVTAWNGSSTTNTHFMNLRNTSGTVTLTANWTAVNVTLPTISKTGHTCGYATSSNGAIVYNSGGSYTPSTTSSSVELFAKCNVNKYYVRYNKNSSVATGTMSDSQHTYDTAKKLSKNTYVRVGYTFKGWSTTSTGNVVYTDEQSIINLATQEGAIVELYAVWNDETAPTCTVAKSNTGKTTGVTTTVTCYDNGSGCKSGNPTGETGLKANKTYTVYDNAGNSGTCEVTITTQIQKATRSCSSCSRCSSAGCAQANSCEYDTGVRTNWSCPTGTGECRSDCGGVSHKTCGVGCGDDVSCCAYHLKDCPKYKTGRNLEKCGCEYYNQNCGLCGCSSWGEWGSWSNVTSCSGNDSTQCQTLYN